MNFGEKIKELRQLNALSQRQVAEILDITQRTVRGWEQEGRLPKQPWIYYSLAALFGCPVDYLIGTDRHDPALISIPEEITPAQVLATTKALFADHKIPKQEQLAFISEIEQIYLTSWEELS